MNHISQPATIEVPEHFHMVDINHLIVMIADMLGCVIIHNDKIPLTPANLTRFHSRASPSISVIDYLRRIVKYTATEKVCLLMLLIYIDRVCERHRSFTITSLTIHRFVIAAITVSSKALCDSYCTNSYYAKVGGIPTHELNTLEFEFLTLIDWNLICSGEDLQQYYINLVKQIANYKIVVSNNNNNIELNLDIDNDEDGGEGGNNDTTMMVIDTPTSSSSSSSLSSSSLSSSSSSSSSSSLLSSSSTPTLSSSSSTVITSIISTPTSSAATTINFSPQPSN